MRVRSFEAEEAGAFDAVALEEDGGGGAGGVDVAGGGGVVDAVDVGEGVVDEGDGVGEDDVGSRSQLVEDLGEGEDGADGVAVGAGVGGEDEAAGGAEGLQERFDVRLLESWFGGGCAVRAGFCGGAFLLAFAHAAEELVHASGHFFGAVDGEGEFGDVAYPHAVAELGADVGAGGR